MEGIDYFGTDYSSVAVGVLEPEADEPECRPAKPQPEPRKRKAARPQQGWLSYQKAADSWLFQWREDGKVRSKTLGHSDALPDRAAAERAAEPLRQAFLQRQEQTPVETLDTSTDIARDIERALEEETAEEVEALFTALDGPNAIRRYARIGKLVFDAYLIRKVGQDMRASLRAMRYDDAGRAKGRNSAFTHASTADLICDVELTIQRSKLTPHQRALLLLLVNMAATEHEIERCFKGQLFEVWAALGREFERKNMADLGTYFAPFAETQRRN